MPSTKPKAAKPAAPVIKPVMVERRAIISVQAIEIEPGHKAAIPLINSYVRSLTATQHVPALTIIALGRLERKAEELLREFVDARFKLVKEYGEEQLTDGKPNGNWSLSAKDKLRLNQFLVEESELLAEQVCIAPVPIKLSQLGTRFSGPTGEDLARCMEVGIIVDDGEQLTTETLQ